MLEHDGVTILVRQRDGARVRLLVAHLSKADREYVRGIDEIPPADPPKTPPQRVPGPGRKPLPYDRLVAWAEPAVARIETDLGRGNRRGGGSGLFVDCNHLVTSFHVIDGAQGAVVVSGDERYPVKGNSRCGASRGQRHSGGHHRRRQKVTRDRINRRINARRAANAAIQGQMFQDATGFRGLY